MRDPKQLALIISFLEDESLEVRKNSLKTLSSFGSTLRELLPVHAPLLTELELQLLYDKLRIYLSENPSPLSYSKFFIAEQIEHKRYGYRGLIVDTDLYCMAEDPWYKQNKTKPSKNQPWHHILIHNSTAVTYAAQSSLYRTGEIFGDIIHPWIDTFFHLNPDGTYLRNDTPWPRD